MSAPQNLTELYIDELKDLWSANDQMQNASRRWPPRPPTKS